MNFLCRPDAEALLSENDFARLWPFFTNMGATSRPGSGGGWLTEAVRERYRAVWRAGLTGGCNYYRASPLRPPTAADSAVMTIRFAPEAVTVRVPTLVVWAEDDIALPPSLLDGLGASFPTCAWSAFRARRTGSCMNVRSWSSPRSRQSWRAELAPRSASGAR